MNTLRSYSSTRITDADTGERTTTFSVCDETGQETRIFIEHEVSFRKKLDRAGIHLDALLHRSPTE
jgi:hypothetical protein